MRKKLRYVFVFCLVIFTLHAGAQQGRLLEVRYTPTFTEGTIEAFLADIQKKTGVSISFSASSVNLSTRVQLSRNERTIESALNAILSDQKVSIVERDDKILVVSRETRKKQQRQELYAINGYIKEESSKEVLIGAAIYIPGLQAGTVSNNYGFYSFSVPEGDYKIVCSYLGFRSDTVSVSLKHDTRRDFFLEADNKLAEIKVTRKVNEAQD